MPELVVSVLHYFVLHAVPAIYRLIRGEKAGIIHITAVPVVLGHVTIEELTTKCFMGGQENHPAY